MSTAAVTRAKSWLRSMGSWALPEPEPVGPVPVLMLSVPAKSGDVYRCITPMLTDPAEVSWSALAGASMAAFDKAAGEHAARGLPRPRLDDCVWHGGLWYPVPVADPPVPTRWPPEYPDS